MSPDTQQIAAVYDIGHNEAEVRPVSSVWLTCWANSLHSASRQAIS